MGSHFHFFHSHLSVAIFSREAPKAEIQVLLKASPPFIISVPHHE